LAKAEWLNPGGSVKDRAAWAMVREAQAQGRLGPDKTLLDATSGNTGIALAMLGAALGFPVQLAMPSNVSPERKRILKAYGAQVDWTAPDQGSDGAIRRARSWQATTRSAFAMWINTRTMPTGKLTTMALGLRSGGRPRAA
jgi:cysteine synthase B